MVIICSTKRRSLAATVFRRCLPLVLLAGSLGACQRASYQFQPFAAAAYEAMPPAPECAVVTLAAQPVMQAVESSRPLRPHPRRPAGRARLLRVKAFVLPTRPTVVASVAAPAPRQEPGPVARPVRHRSRGVAIVLAALAITYLPLSLHNFYLGYYERGAAAITLLIAGLYLFLLGALGGIFTSTGLTGVGIIGVAMLGVWFSWQLSDLVRIITNNLKPKNGEYGPRLF